MPGRFARWYVFPRTTWHSRSHSCCEVSPFRLPCVPTGMNIGVRHARSPRVNVKRVARARPSVASTSNRIGESPPRASPSDAIVAPPVRCDTLFTFFSGPLLFLFYGAFNPSIDCRP